MLCQAKIVSHTVTGVEKMKKIVNRKSLASFTNDELEKELIQRKIDSITNGYSELINNLAKTGTHKQGCGLTLDSELSYEDVRSDHCAACLAVWLTIDLRTFVWEHYQIKI